MNKMKPEISIENRIKISKLNTFLFILLIGIQIYGVILAVSIGTYFFLMWLLSTVILIAMLFKEHEKRKLLVELQKYDKT